MGTWDTILVIQGSKGSPNRHLEVQVCIFNDFKIILGVPWESLWGHFSDFSVIWDAKMEDCFQVHVFSDPWMEMMPDCRGCMCYNHGKTDVFERFHFSHLFMKLMS